MKRFWKRAEVVKGNEGFSITLDGRIVKTPKRRDLIVPQSDLADHICAEWQNCGADIDPAKMPMTGYANAALDRVADERGAFISAVAAYGETDVFCYRAENPVMLVERQSQAWDMWIAWACKRYDMKLILIAGIMHQPQPAKTVQRFGHEVARRSDFEIAAMAKLANLSGSLIATLALVEGEGDANSLWAAACLDEDWQAEKWGVDAFATKNRSDRQNDFMEAARFLELVRE